MAGVALADTLQRVVREQWRMNLMLGSPSGPGRTVLLSAAWPRPGRDPAQVRAWMAGEAQPTTAQAIAVLDALPEPKAAVA